MEGRLDGGPSKVLGYRHPAWWSVGEVLLTTIREETYQILGGRTYTISWLHSTGIVPWWWLGSLQGLPWLHEVSRIVAYGDTTPEGAILITIYVSSNALELWSLQPSEGHAAALCCYQVDYRIRWFKLELSWKQSGRCLLIFLIAAGSFEVWLHYLRLYQGINSP